MPFTNIRCPFTKAKKAYGPGSKVVTVSLRRCSSKSKPQMQRTESTKSCSSTDSTSTLRGCLKLVKRGVSTMLTMPMPFWDSSNDNNWVKKEPLTQMREPRGLKRILSRRRSQANGSRRNSLVLPEVPMPDESEEPTSPVTRRPSECTIRESPPPFQDRTTMGLLGVISCDTVAFCFFFTRMDIT
ncbi:hypothetical protein C8R47DRAFT_1082315 [Mycena vitilis]|nr:hypothetical protein C8R47DRAFT_1082315 [Mycena vitilis]